MNVDVEQLLTIDVDSEIRKLAEAELGGSWQIPAELVRRSLRAGAGRVDVSFEARGVRITDDGPPIEDASIEALAALFEPSRGPAVRHRALLDLERAGEVGLISLVGLEARGLRIVCEGVERLRRGAPKGTSLPRRGVIIEAEGAVLDFTRAKKWLEVALRFAPAAVTLDGVELPRGSKDAIVDATLQPPLEGTVALVRSAETARVWMLRWGVVATHTTLPGGFNVEASIELGERGKGQVGAGELREAFKPELVELEDQAVELALATAAEMGKLEPADRQKLRMLLLNSASLAKSAPVRKVKMLPALYGPTQALEWSSIDQLVHHGADKSVLAVDDEAKAANAVTQQPIYVLSPAERARLSQLFGVSFAPPPVGVKGGAVFSFKGFAESSARVARAAAGLVAGTWQKALPLEALTEEEREALKLFRAAATSSKRPAFTEVEICDGDGPAVLRAKTKKLVLPRSNADVAAAVKAVAKDPAWAYPALTMLLGGAAMPSSVVRDRWARGR